MALRTACRQAAAGTTCRQLLARLRGSRHCLEAQTACHAALEQEIASVRASSALNMHVCCCVCVSNADSRHAGCPDHCKARLRLVEPPALLLPPFAPPVVDERDVPAGRAVGVVDAMLPARPSCNFLRWAPAPPSCASGRCFELGGEPSLSSSCTSSSPSQPSCRNLSH